jgi:hypothetical protein
LGWASVAARNSDRVDVATKVARHSPEQLRCDELKLKIYPLLQLQEQE